jgi:hypothetical protein
MIMLEADIAQRFSSGLSALPEECLTKNAVASDSFRSELNAV